MGYFVASQKFSGGTVFTIPVTEGGQEPEYLKIRNNVDFGRSELGCVTIPMSDAVDFAISRLTRCRRFSKAVADWYENERKEANDAESAAVIS